MHIIEFMAVLKEIFSEITINGNDAIVFLLQVAMLAPMCVLHVSVTNFFVDTCYFELKLTRYVSSFLDGFFKEKIRPFK